MKKVKVGVVGCGGICKKTYMSNMINVFEIIEVAGCADLIDSRAQWMSDHYGIKKMSLEEIMNDPEIEVIVNLTYPESHVEISSEAMKHGKHVYCEKMMAPTFEEATKLMELMRRQNVMYTTAPDTFLGAWEQSARKYLDDGIVGKPVTVHAQVTAHYEPETPFFDTLPKTYFFPLHYGGGFPYDLGGYYLHEMINLFGSIKRVTGFGGNINPHRIFTNPKHPQYGQPFEVNTPTTLLAALEFENGVLGTFHISSDSYNSRSFVVTGTEGTLTLGDPNMFNDEIHVLRRGARPKVARIMPGQQPDAACVKQECSDEDIQMLAEKVDDQEVVLPLLHGYYESSRGIGLADMCYAIRNHRRPRCHANIGYHAMEAIHGILESAKTKQTYEMLSRCERPEPLPTSAYSFSGQERTLDN